MDHDKFLIEHIVPYQAMGFELSLKSDEASIFIPLEKNTNDKGTLFAGSIASAFSLSGWALLHNYCLHQSVNVDIVLAESKCRFITPVGSNSCTRTLPISSEGLE